MKLKSAGKIWEVDYIVATNPRTHECQRFYSGYDMIPDEPTPNTEIGALDRLVARDVIELSTSHMRLTESVKNLESNNTTSTLLNHHDAILLDHAGCIGSLQEEYAKAKSWINTIISDNQRLKDRLNAIESGYTQGEP